MSRLKHVLSKRWDGYWEPLATAVGVPEAVAKSCEMLSAHRLAGVFEHPDCIIAERVEAIAAWDETLLLRLAETWDSPWHRSWQQLVDAWGAGLRFLKARGVVQRDRVDTPELAEEVNILWDEEYMGEIYWSQALEFLSQAPIFNYDRVRRMSRRWRLAKPLPTIDGILEAPPWLLPMLRGQAASLDARVKEFLLNAAEECLQGDLKPMTYVAIKENYDHNGRITSVYRIPKGYRPFKETPLKGNISDAPPIVEICREFAPDFLQLLGDRLAEKVESVSDPRSIAKVVYLLTSSWCLP